MYFIRWIRKNWMDLAAFDPVINGLFRDMNQFGDF